MPASAVRSKTRRNHLDNFVRALHVLDVDVKEHIDTLELDEDFIANEERRIGRTKFLDAADKASLKKILKAIFVVLSHLEKIEEYLENGYTRTFIDTQAPFAIATLESTKDIHKIADALSYTLTDEENILHTHYLDVLDKTESTFRDLVGVEAHILETATTQKERLARINNRLRTVIIDSIRNVSDDIVTLYEDRLKLFNELIKLAQKKEPKLVPLLLHKMDQFERLKNGYESVYAHHTLAINDIYESAGGYTQ